MLTLKGIKQIHVDLLEKSMTGVPNGTFSIVSKNIRNFKKSKRKTVARKFVNLKEQNKWFGAKK